MNHKENCPISIAQTGSWYSTAKPMCNCGGLTHTGYIPSDGANPPNLTGGNTGVLTPLGEEKLKALTDFSGSIYKHIVYNPHMRNIDAVINQAQGDGKDWQFSHAQPVTEYEWVAVFEKWIS